MYITLVHEILALISVHSGFYKCFCSELSFKPIHYHAALTVLKECKMISLRLFIPLTHWGSRCQNVGAVYSCLHWLFTGLFF